MSLSQVQIIRSFGEALAWFEKELAWGVQPAQLGHLTCRIGELYAAMITRGQMALTTHQHGYSKSSTFLRLSGYRAYIITTRRITSGDELE